jgi:signal transduction histidine kinase
MQAPSLPVPIATRLSNAIWVWSQRRWRFVVIAMLVLLHVAAVRGMADSWARALLLAHLGLLLLWQPLLHGEQRVSTAQAGFIAFGAAAVMLWLDWWLLAFWVVVLVGLVGGKVFLYSATWQRRYYLVVLVYLLALLTVVILPEIAPSREIAPEIRSAAEYGLPLLFLVLAAIPAEPEPAEAAQVIDFFYSIFLMLVLGVVILGSFTFMTLERTSYLEALMISMFLIAGTIFAIGLAWNPSTGFAGLNVFFSRYLFSIGLPVEKWLYFLAELAQLESRPERVLAEGVAGLVRLPWVAGAVWHAGTERGESGERTAHGVEYRKGDFALTVYSRYRTSPALHWHLQLLGQLLAEFYVAKVREQKLLHQSYLQAVHETGARITHDVKNLLQSLSVLCSMAASEAGDSPQLQALIRRQLPAIAQRLGETLERLQRPEMEAAPQISAQDWWDALLRRSQGRGVEFHAEGLGPGANVPGAVFDSVADNLIQNAIVKRAAGSPVRVRVSLAIGEPPDLPELRVRDSGLAVPATVQRLLMRAPVPSATGLGIGLLQAARHAESIGFRLELSSNRDGEVCFTLSRTGAHGRMPAEIIRE